ncbi:unnamed protein product [Calypogeia fissa]
MCRAFRDMVVIDHEPFLSYNSSPGVMKALVKNMADIWIRKLALEIIAKLSQNEENDLLVVAFSQALDGIVCCLNDIHELTSGIAAHALMTLALAQNAIIRERVKATGAQSEQSVINGLVLLVEGAPDRLKEAGLANFDFYSKEREYCAAVALTMFDPDRGNQLTMHSGRANGRRGHANFVMRSVQKALKDLVKAHKLEPEHAPILRYTFSLYQFVH